VSGELFKMMASVDMVHVPYRGEAPALTDLIGGQVQGDIRQLALDRYFARLCSTQDLVNNFGRASCVIRQERTST
jgi:hypothetical protein